MGRYVDEILQPGERLLYATTVHWIIYLPAIAGWLIAAAALFAARGTPSATMQYVWLGILLASGAYASISGFRAWFRRWTAEVDVTDRRIIHKEGFIERRTIEMNMDKVESVDVSQSILGRILDYGEVRVHGVGESWEPIPTIGSPLKFRNCITAR